MYIKSMLNKRWITLPVVYCRPFASKAVFWAILKDFEAQFTRFLIVDETVNGDSKSFKIAKKPLLRQIKHDNIPQVR